MLGQEKKKRLSALAHPKLRQKKGQYLLEGKRAVALALSFGAKAIELLAESQSDLPAGYQGHWTLVSSREIRDISQLNQPSSLLGVFEEEHLAFPPAVWPTKAVGLFGIQDPGNLGTMLRTCHAFGVKDVFLFKGCADPFGVKAARAAMGSVAALNLYLGIQPETFAAVAREAGVAPMFLDPDARQGLKKLKGPSVLMVGSEGEGFKGFQFDAQHGYTLKGPSSEVPLNAAQALTLGLFQAYGGND